jgi:hypothetical protein
MSFVADFNPAKLRSCPECGGRWPNGPDYSLRGCAWLHGLPRRISPSNNEILIHDGSRGDRFLQLEIKGPKEKWPLQDGQLRTLNALARQSNWIVLILRQMTHAVDVYRVGGSGLSAPVRSHTEAIRQAVASWLNGALWRDVEPVLGKQAEGHVCGWARVGGVWTCVQDHYATGVAPETACGNTLPQFS